MKQPRAEETDVLSGGGSDQIERIRSKLYDFVSQNPSGEQADQARRILGKLPKIKTSADLEDALQLSKGSVQVGANKYDVGDAAEYFPSRDEELGLEKGVAKPGIGTRAVTGMTDPHKRREFERGVDDMVGFGLGQKIARLGEKVSPTPGEGGFSPEGSALDATRAPGYRTGGQFLGAMLPGATRYITHNIGAPIQEAFAIPTASNLMGRIFAGGMAGAATNTLAMPVIAGGQAAVRGENPLPVMAEEIKNPLNPIAGAAFGIPAGMARGIREGHSQTGRDIRLTESYGATPSPFGGAKNGVFNAPIFEGAEGSTREAGKLATRSAREVIGGLEGEQRNLSNTFAQEKAAAGEAGQLEGLVKPDAVLAEADNLLRSMRLELPQKAQIQAEVINALKEHPNGIPVDQFNDFRAKLYDLSGFGEQGAAKHPAMANLFSEAKSAIDDTEMGPINLKYHQGKEALRQKYAQLKIKQEMDPRVREDRLAGEILRRGENTPTSGIQETHVDEFLASNPKYKPLFDAVSLLNAKERMGLSLQSHGGSLYTRMHGALHHNLEPLAVGAYRLGSGLEDKTAVAAMIANYLRQQEDQP